jgi:hypothetical protein
MAECKGRTCYYADSDGFWISQLTLLSNWTIDFLELYFYGVRYLDRHIGLVLGGYLLCGVFYRT